MESNLTVSMKVPVIAKPQPSKPSVLFVADGKERSFAWGKGIGPSQDEDSGMRHVTVSEARQILRTKMKKVLLVMPLSAATLEKGVELWKDVRKALPGIPVVFLSNLPMSELRPHFAGQSDCPIFLFGTPVMSEVKAVIEALSGNAGARNAA